jgi:hypothetical protein
VYSNRGKSEIFVVVAIDGLESADTFIALLTKLRVRRLVELAPLHYLFILEPGLPQSVERKRAS